MTLIEAKSSCIVRGAGADLGLLDNDGRLLLLLMTTTRGDFRCREEMATSRATRREPAKVVVIELELERLVLSSLTVGTWL